MGVVYLAEKIATGERVALKVLSPALSESFRTIERFRREAEISTRLRHRNIVPTLETGEADGQVFFVMEHVEGVNLAQVLAALRDKGTKGLPRVVLASVVAELLGDAPIPGVDIPSGRHSGYFGAIARIVAEVADALEYAHAQDVIHRDVKPGNILLRRDLRPLLADFGLAKDLSAASLTRSGDLVGTYHYLSPELAMSGRVPVTPRTDVYSLGVTLYEAITLAVPFPGDSAPKVLHEIAFQDPPDPRRLNPAIPTPLAAIALAAMEKRPDRRYGSAAEMAEDLRRFLRFEPISRRVPGPLRRAARWVRRHPIPAGAAAVLLVGVGAFAGVRGAMLDDRLDRLEIALANGDLKTARDGFAAFLEEHPEEPRAVRSLEEARAAIRSEVDRLQRGAAALMERGEESDFAEAAVLLRKALDLEPSPLLEASYDEARGFFPVAIESDPPGARVYRFLVEERTGALSRGEDLGTATPPSARCGLGFHRLVFEVPGRGFAEVTLRVVRREGPRTVRVKIPLGAEATAGMRRIPAGEYAIGRDRRGVILSGELPAGTARLAAFDLDEAEVTNGEYAEFLEATGCGPPFTWTENGGSYPTGAGDLPVEGVTWYDALSYANWKGKRLPTEEEWEVACRGPEGRAFPWGWEWAEGIADIPPPGPREPRTIETACAVPVRSEPAGRGTFGVFHLVGNVQEWVWNSWSVPDGVRDAFGGPGMRVVRGGSCSSYGTCTMRTFRKASLGSLSLGFRCARSAEPPRPDDGQGSGR